MLALLLVKASILLLAVLALARIAARASAASRHRFWSLAFSAMLALPLLAVFLPPVAVPVPDHWITAQIVSVPALATDAPGRGPSAAGGMPGESAHDESLAAASARVTPSAPPSVPPATTAVSPFAIVAATRSAVSPITLVMALWVLGFVAALARITLSQVRVRALARGAVQLREAAWVSAASDLSRRLGLKRQPVLLAGRAIATPMAGGFWRAVVFLPESATSWDADRRDVVLAHELAHLARRDPLRHLVVRVTLAVYWFHPLAWLAARHASIAREHACDETVVALGTRRSTYARVLLDLAGPLSPRPPAAALPIVQPSLLEGRVMAILNGPNRPSGPRLFVWPLIGVAAVTLSLAAVRPLAAPATQPPHEVDSLTPVEAASVQAAASQLVPAVERALTAPLAAMADQLQARFSAGGCADAFSQSSSFQGMSDTTRIAGRTVIREQVGTSGLNRIIRKMFGDLELCMVAEEAGPADDSKPSEWITRARRTVMEVRRGSVLQRMEFGRQTGVGSPVTWQVGAQTRAVDDQAVRWRDRMLAALDLTWEAVTLRGQASGLQGEISALQGERSALQGEISALMGEVSAMQGNISAAHGEESSLQGEISAIRGQVSALKGSISAEQGAISSLNAARYGLIESDRNIVARNVTAHEAEIARLQREIRAFDADGRVAKVQKQMASLNTDGKIAALQKQIGDFDLTGKIAAIEKRIAALNVDGKTAAIQGRIDALDADRRARQIEQRLDEAVKQLEAAIGAIR